MTKLQGLVYARQDLKGGLAINAKMDTMDPIVVLVAVKSEEDKIIFVTKLLVPAYANQDLKGGFAMDVKMDSMALIASNVIVLVVGPKLILLLEHFVVIIPTANVHARMDILEPSVILSLGLVHFVISVELAVSKIFM